VKGVTADLIDGHEDAGDDVAQDGLYAERHGNADDRGAGQQRSDVETEFGQDHQADDDQQETEDQDQKEPASAGRWSFKG